MEWPSDKQIRRHRCDDRDVPSTAISDTERWLRSAIRDEWIPADLTTYMTPMREWDGKDWFVMRYKRMVGEKAYWIEILENNYATHISVYPPPVGRTQRNAVVSANGARRCALRLLRFPASRSPGPVSEGFTSPRCSIGVFKSLDTFVQGLTAFGEPWFKYLPWYIDEDGVSFLLHRKWFLGNLHGLAGRGPNVVEDPIDTKFLPSESARCARRLMLWLLPIAILVTATIVMKFHKKRRVRLTS